MIFRIIGLLFISFCLSVFIEIESTAFAGGGRDPEVSQPKESASSTGKSTMSKSQQDRAIRGSLRFIELTLAALEREAKNNNLRRIALDSRKITNLRTGIDVADSELDDTKHRNDPQKITDLLLGYSKSKTNAELAFFAKNILSAIFADRQYFRALLAIEAHRKALKAGNYTEASKQQVEYEWAREEFNGHANSMNKKLRNRLFDPLPKEIPK